MSERKIPGPIYDNETKNKILDVATELFAQNGFGAVSMRDISSAVGIKASAIYYYYDSKDALMEDILSRFEKGYRHYFEWLTSVNEKVETLEELMDNMFNKEFLEILNPMACLGISLVIKEQHNNASARRLVLELLYEYSIRLMQEDFDRLVEKGVIPPADTKTIATFFMFSVLAGNDIRIHEYAGTQSPINCTEMYHDLKKFITEALQKGI